MEVWPIERHLEEFQKQITAQCVFIAPSIFNDSLQQINFVSFQSKGERTIRPYAINEFVDYLENSQHLYAKQGIHIPVSYPIDEDLAIAMAAED